jgi:predicted kinase
MARTTGQALNRRETMAQQSENMLIVMRGYPGTGKSTIARALARTLQIPLIDRDIIRQTAVDILGYRPEIGRFAYDLLFALSRKQLELNLSVIIDTPLTYRRTYEQAREMAQSFRIPMLVIHCQCPSELQKRRLEGRKGTVSQFQITSWEEWEHWKPRFEEYEDEGCIVNTANPIHDSLTHILFCLRERQKQTSQLTG